MQKRKTSKLTLSALSVDAFSNSGQNAGSVTQTSKQTFTA